MGLLQDIRFAIRTHRQRPGFALGVILILGIGMGGATGLLDMTNFLAWQALPVASPQEVVKVFTASHSGFTGPYFRTSYPDYRDYRDASRSFAHLAAHTERELRAEIGDGGRDVTAAAVGGSYFDVLGLGMTAGRPLTAEDDRPGAEPVAVVSHTWWRELGEDPRILGRTVRLEGQPYTVVGVAPAGFTNTTAGTVVEVFIPLAGLPVLTGRGLDVFEDRSAAWVEILGRLRPGVDLGEVQAELSALALRLDADHPRPGAPERRVTVTAAKRVHPVDRDRMAPSLRIFGAAVGLLWILTCANVAHLLLARGVERRREMAVRRSVGAGGFALVRQVWAESLVLALGGGAVGLAVAFWSRGILAAFASPEFAGAMGFDLRVLGYGFLLCLASTLICGTAPALRAASGRAVEELRGGTAIVRGRFDAGRLLAGAQVGLCVLLLIAGALLVQSLQLRLGADIGFEDEDLLIVDLELPAQQYTPEEGVAFYRQLREGAAALPGVDRASSALLMPPILFDLTLPFHLPEDASTPRKSRLNYVDSGFFETLGIPLEAGRVFGPSDRRDGTAVVVVNRRAAETLWPGLDPLGRSIRLDSSQPGDPGPLHEVIGVVGSIDQHRASQGGEPVLYFSSDQRYRPRQRLVLRSEVDTAATLGVLRELLQRMDPSLTLGDPRTGRSNREAAFTFERMQSLAVGSFAVAGFLLAVLGVFGVLSVSVRRRVREMGIRMALGARRRDVRRQVVGEGMRMATVGALVGVAATPLLSGVLGHLLFGIHLWDLKTLFAVPLGVLAVTAAAAFLPALRASRFDPLRALRHE
ncbi:MAG: ABC transporter permease [Acidobacteriota bacterium]